MASDDLFDACLGILRDDTLDDDDRTDRVEALVKRESALSGKALENTVLDILWRFRSTSSGASPVVRNAVLARRQSPAPWSSSRSGTPGASSPRSSAASPAPPPGLGVRPAMFRMRSSQHSPFTSPRASPRLPVASTVSYSPRSPSFEPRPVSQSQSLKPSITDPYGEYGGDDNDDWPGADDASQASSPYHGTAVAASSSSDSNAWIQPQTTDMTPYDILRSIFRDQKSDDEIEAILEANGYDLSAAIASLMGSADGAVPAGSQDRDGTLLVGKSMNPTSSRPTTPAGHHAKSPVVCRYWLSTGQCLRADCRFSHDLTSHVCKYWLAGSCLAGDSCIFSHDPSSLMTGLSLQDAASLGTSLDTGDASLQVQDYQAFPTLLPTTSESSLRSAMGSFGSSSSFSSRPALAPEFIPSSQRAASGTPTTVPSPGLVTDDGDAFPTLGSAAAQRGHKKHHGKRSHGHGGSGGKEQREGSSSSSMADVVRQAPAPSSSPSAADLSRSPRTPSNRGTAKSRAGASVAVIPAPEHIPWLETGATANQAYLKARAEAIRHGGARNKFLQSAAQAWNRSDVRAAKALSLRGQSENDLMRDAHREAARLLYDDRNRNTPSAEVYIDLHGLHPAEAVSYLTQALTRQKTQSAVQRAESTSRFLYAIVGTGHHSKGGRDKVGKAVRNYLADCGYAFRDFSVPGDRGGSGGILGIDVQSGGAGFVTAADGEASGKASPRDRQQPQLQQGKIRILRQDERRDGVGGTAAAAAASASSSSAAAASLAAATGVV